MPLPTFGVEEEFLLVDPDTGEPAPLNRAVADNAAKHTPAGESWTDRLKSFFS